MLKRTFIIIGALLLLLVLTACSQTAVGEGKHKHSFGEWRTAKEATCTETGVQTRVCRECSYTEKAEIASYEHKLATSTAEPTCTTEGYTAYACACGYSYKSDFVTPIAHSFSKKVTPSTCTEQGYTTYTCECGHTYKSDFTAPEHHGMSKKVTEPTCTAEGFTSYSCDCGYQYDSDFVPPLGHKLDSDITPPTCTSAGSTHFSCENCDYEYVGDILAPLAHKNSDTRRFFPTVLTEGYQIYTCLDCGHIYKDNFVSYKDILPSATVENTQILQKGIDIYSGDHYTDADGNYLPLNWEALKAAGVDFVILKAGSSKSGKDPTFDMDYAAARAAGLKVGAYFYTYSSTVSATLDDAEQLLSWIDGKQFEYPIYFDLEDPSLAELEPTYLTEMCLTFADALQSRGYYCGLYANHNWLFNILETDVIKESFDIWYARYPTQPVDPPADFFIPFDGEPLEWNEEKFGEQLGMWQYTDKGKIEGFKFHFDFNYSYKDYSKIMKDWKLNGMSDSDV